MVNTLFSPLVDSKKPSFCAHPFVQAWEVIVAKARRFGQLVASQLLFDHDIFICLEYEFLILFWVLGFEDLGKSSFLVHFNRILCYTRVIRRPTYFRQQSHVLGSLPSSSYTWGWRKFLRSNKRIIWKHRFSLMRPLPIWIRRLWNTPRSRWPDSWHWHRFVVRLATVHGTLVALFHHVLNSRALSFSTDSAWST